MPLTSAQRTTLRTFIAADPTAAALSLAGNVPGLRDWLNASAGVTAWRAVCEAKTLDEGADYAAFDSVVAGKRDAWDLFLRYAPRDMGRNKNRKVVTDVWGNATAGSVAESILQAATETATRAQNAIGGTQRTTGAVSALDRIYAELVTDNEVSTLINGEALRV